MAFGKDEDDADDWKYDETTLGKCLAKFWF